jgi:hypothetical protein
MNLPFKLMIFSLCLNISAGLMYNMFPFFTDHANLNGGITYNETYANSYIEQMNSTINPGGVMEDKGNLIYRVLDMINIGYIYKFLTSVYQYLFGFVYVLQGLFGNLLLANGGQAVYYIVFGALHSFILISYVLGAWRLWTGKDIVND